MATFRPVVDVVDEPLDEHSRPPWHCDLLPAPPPHFSYLRTWHLLRSYTTVVRSSYTIPVLEANSRELDLSKLISYTLRLGALAHLLTRALFDTMLIAIES